MSRGRTWDLKVRGIGGCKGLVAPADVDENIPRRRRRFGETLALSRLRTLQIREFNNRSLFRNGYHERVRLRAVEALFASARERMERQSRERPSITAAKDEQRYRYDKDAIFPTKRSKGDKQTPYKDDLPAVG